MDMALSELCRKGLITSDAALTHSVDREMLARMLSI
jgi:hypothetical protein